MYKSKLRKLGMSALLGAGLLATGPANAYNMRLGDVDIQIDTTASVGLSFRVADRETDLLPWVNGGPGETLRGVTLGENDMGTIDLDLDLGFFGGAGFFTYASCHDALLLPARFF